MNIGQKFHSRNNPSEMYKEKFVRFLTESFIILKSFNKKFTKS